MSLTAAVLWCGVVLLSLLGISAAVSRALDVGAAVGHDGPQGRALSAPEQLALEQIGRALHIEPGSTRYTEAEADAVAFNRPHIAHPIATLLHVLPGALFLILGPLQFSSGIRDRYIRFHRWSGRMLLLMVIPIGLTAFFFGLPAPFGGGLEVAAIVVFGGLFLFAAARAFIAIRHGDVARHREWMIRMFSVAIGVSTIRVVFVAVGAATHLRPRTVFGPSLWVGWVLTLAVAELWIRCTKPAEAPAAGAIAT